MNDTELEILFNLDPETAFNLNPLWIYTNKWNWMKKNHEDTFLVYFNEDIKQWYIDIEYK